MKYLLFFVSNLYYVSWSYAQKKMTPEDYISKYFQLAVAEMNAYKIPASITLAQGLIETENGNSLLATKANNHFGIKCKSDWTGPTFIKDDDTKNECFRSYGSVEDSYRDHSVFLLKPRYSTLFNHEMTDYRSWAYGLKQAGYATNPNYPAMLIKLIEDYKLFQFDKFGLEKVPPAVEKPIEKKPQLSREDLIKLRKQLANNLDLVIVDEGFDIYRLASVTKNSIETLLEFNDIEGEQPIRMGQNFFLQKKSKSNPKEKHTTLIGESLYDISQMYGVSLKLLRKYNKLENWEQPRIGEVIYLNKYREDFIKTRPFYEIHRERTDKNLELFFPIDIPESISAKTDSQLNIQQSNNTNLLGVNKPMQTSDEKVEEQRVLKLNATAVLEPILVKNNPAEMKIEQPLSSENKVWINHTVKPKETVFRISKMYSCKPNEVLNWNALTIEQNLKVGQSLRVYTQYPNGIALEVPKPNENMDLNPKLKSNESVNKMPNILKTSSRSDTEKSKIDSTTKTFLKTTPKEPQKPRIVILKSPQTTLKQNIEINYKASDSSISARNREIKSEKIADLYKSLRRDSLSLDTSIKRRIKLTNE